MLFNISLPAIAGCMFRAVSIPVRRFRHVCYVGFQPLSVAERCSSQGVPILECEVCYWVCLSSDARPPAYRLLSARVSVCLLCFIEFFRFVCNSFNFYSDNAIFVEKILIFLFFCRYRVPWWVFALVPGFQVPQRRRPATFALLNLCASW